MTSSPGLARRLGTTDAVVIGLGSMIGAGVFAAFGPAARAAGTGLLIGLALAAAVAYCNATASAQLAAQYPASGGAYLYGRERLGPWWGFLAGWAFVVGKTASCAAMALTFAAYAVPPAWERPVAVAAVVVLVAVNCRGVTRTAGLTRVLVAVVLSALTAAVLASLVAGGPDADRLLTWTTGEQGWYGVLQSAGLLFFAFAGYARIATMGEEVRDPARTIPGPSPRPRHRGRRVRRRRRHAAAHPGLRPDRRLGRSAGRRRRRRVLGVGLPVVRVGAAAAALGALLGLVAGVGRTGLAMARTGDLPRRLAAVHPRHRVPHRAEITLGALVCVLVLTVDLRSVIGFSSFGVLLYYLVANLAAFTQTADHRRWSRALQVAGAAGCLVLAATLPWQSVAAGVVVVAIGVLYRGVRLRTVG
ncbi:APC family permease [Blastococcus brunescens]|uniref:APC family permease n=1 Tax=Blastococcus brunescens TaxID=1564165 RepID=A0ABZ1B4V1_9ACTN|nr:APC family permease [Blastococcus sp. BMG 8361]WRL65829.1 APC family permease [Blastococcus sp. BMG 8361]